jgi:hypothetical protein
MPPPIWQRLLQSDRARLHLVGFVLCDSPYVPQCLLLLHAAAIFQPYCRCNAALATLPLAHSMRASPNSLLHSSWGTPGSGVACGTCSLCMRMLASAVGYVLVACRCSTMFRNYYVVCSITQGRLPHDEIRQAVKLFLLRQHLMYCYASSCMVTASRT